MDRGALTQAPMLLDHWKRSTVGTGISFYVGLSHVWAEGLGRDQVRDGVEKHKV